MQNSKDSQPGLQVVSFLFPLINYILEGELFEAFDLTLDGHEEMNICSSLRQNHELDLCVNEEF